MLLFMSLQRLRTFIEVYRQRSISNAARSLNLTQPAVSQHISGLEVAIGRKLFEREPRGVLPTLAADELAADLGDKLDSAEAALSSAKARSVELTGELRIIGHGDFLAEVFTARLQPLLEAGVRVRLHKGDRELITNMLLEGHCDLGICAYPTSDKRLRCELIRNERVMAVASPAVAKKIADAPDFRKALAAEPLLAYDLELSLIDNWLSKNKVDLSPMNPALIGQDLRSLRILLCNNFGWTALPEYLCAEHIANGQLAEIPAHEGSTNLGYYLVWTPSALRQPRVAHARKALLEQLRDSAA